MNSWLLEQLQLLEVDLAPLTHNAAILERVRSFAAGLGAKTGQRQAALNVLGVLMQSPITFEAAIEKGYSFASDAFHVLQGDVISTQSAFFMGERLTGDRRYLILTPTCDLVSHRRAFAGLLELKAITSDTPNVGGLLSSLTAFKRSDAMYLPPLEFDLEQGVLGYAVSFDGVCNIGNSEIQSSTRLASVSLAGWRIFCAMLQSVLTRASVDEIALRKAFL